jgi:transcriptional regulator with XRE-family HTH domain
MENFGARLKEERKRLGLNQAQLAELAATSNVAQSRYETGDRSPDWEYLSRVADAGVDVLYVLTGQRDTSNLEAVEADLVRRFREAPEAVRAAALAALSAGTSSGKYQQDLKGASIEQQVSTDVTAPFSINISSRRKKAT